MPTNSERQETLPNASSKDEVETLQDQLREMRDLLARYQEHVLMAEAALAAYEGREDNSRAGHAGRAIMSAGTARLLELLVSSKTVEIARQGLSEVETPWRKEFVRNPLAISRWGALRRAQRRLRRDPELRKRLAVLDHSGG